MTKGHRPLQYTGVRSPKPPNIIQAKRDPTASDTAYITGDIWINVSTPASFEFIAGFGWLILSRTQVGSIDTITGDSGGAETPLLGNFNLLGTANQITVTGTAHTETFHIPTTFIAPGTIASTTTITAGTALIATTSVTAGTTITATLGNITATAGNFVSSTLGDGLLLNSPSNSGVASGPVVVNGRSGRATFTSVSIAAAADLTLTITNSAVTAVTTEVLISMSGATTGSALSIKSKTASSGSLAIVVTNGTGATTTTADIQIDFLVLNA